MNVPFERESAAAHRGNLIAWFLGLGASTAGRVTDFNEGSNTRTWFGALAIRLEHLDSKVFGALRRAIPTMLYDIFSFPALPAVPAVGPVRFQRRPGVVGELPVPIDSVLTVSPEGSTAAEKLYRVIVPAFMPAGATFVDTLAQATVPGVVGNTPANTLALKAIAGNPSGTSAFLGATNPGAFLSGQEAETSEQRRARFVEFIRNLGRAQLGGLAVGAKKAVVMSGGQVVERALYARALDVPDKRGLTDVYIDNGGGGASAALLAAAQAILDGGFAADGTPIPGYKASGMVAIARAVEPQILDVSCTIRVVPGYTYDVVAAAVRVAVEEHLFNLGVFEPLVHAGLVGTIKALAGVADVAVTAPATNVSTGQGARILPGVVTVTAMAPV